MIIFFIIVFSLFGLYLYSRVYFKPVTVIEVSPGSTTVRSIKPTKRYLKELSRGSSGFVSLGNTYFAFYSYSSEAASNLTFDNVTFEGPIYIFSRKFLRFRSIDLHDRALNDIIKKINEV